jgi:hypothetical protein
MTHRILRPRWEGGGVLKEVPFTAHRSKWGWHPVSYEDFQILRDLHKRYWKTLRQAYAWQRWARKEPQNRVVYRKIRDKDGTWALKGQVIGREVVCALPEPRVDPIFIDTSKKSEFAVPYQPKDSAYPTCRTHHCLFTPRLGPQIIGGYRGSRTKPRPCIVEDFQLARTPQEDPEKLATLDMSLYREVWAELTAGAV